MNRIFLLATLILIFGCQENNELVFKTIDTDFSKGRLGFEQDIDLNDLVKFHGHLCDGLVVGALAFQEAVDVLYPNAPIDRTNLRIVSQSSPCLTDVAIYLSGGRYQFNTFYVDNEIDGIYILQRIDNKKAVKVNLNKDIKPSAIDSLGAIAVQQKLPACDIDQLKKLEDEFTDFLLSSNPKEIFTVEESVDFKWNPNPKNNFIKTDILNKDLGDCF